MSHPQTPQTREKIRQARTGMKASEATKALLRETQSKKRGSYRQKWLTIHRMCDARHYHYEKTRNAWLITDDLGTVHHFHNTAGATAFLKKGFDYTDAIVTLCEVTGYTLRMEGRIFAIYDGQNRRAYINSDGKSVVNFLESMRKWMALRGLLKKVDRRG